MPHPAPAAPAPAEPAPPAAAATPEPATAPAAPAASASGSANLSDQRYGFDADAEAAAPDEVELDRAWRATSLHLGSALSGSTGLLHVIEAGAGAPGTFRFSVTGSYFAGSGFCVTAVHPAPRS
ncbi:MAG: hypothetical protein WDO74_37505 [Pseudomonadota bacterium]